MGNEFRILFGYDGSRFADAALDDLRSAGLPKKADALVLSVAEVWLPPDHPGKKPEFITPELTRRYEESLRIVDDSRALAKAAANRLMAAFPDWSVTSDATYGSPAWEILSRADDLKPDLIVVGAQGVYGLKELLIGSVAQKIVSEARCSVRVARGRIDVETTPNRIVFGYDGSSGADRALDALAGRSWPELSAVKVVIVRDSSHVRSSFEIDDGELEQAGNRIVDKLARAGLTASLLILDGNPKQLIIKEAENWGADSIFIGATKFNDALTKYLFGSVSSAIVTRAHCSVEVVR